MEYYFSIGDYSMGDYSVKGEVTPQEFPYTEYSPTHSRPSETATSNPPQSSAKSSCSTQSAPETCGFRHSFSWRATQMIESARDRAYAKLLRFWTTRMVYQRNFASDTARKR